MKDNKPEITTFVSSKAQIKTALKAGASHLILEDPKLSIRSFSKDFSLNNFDRISLLANYAKKLVPKIILSYNLDIICHNHHFPLINKLINTLKKENILIIRIQDPGILNYLKNIYPKSKLYLATETGNNNLESISEYKNLGIIRQTLTNELSFKEIKKIASKVDAELEIQVSGPILIQQSNRRLLYNYFTKSLKHSNADRIIRQGKDKDFPNIHFTFYDNPHGHFTYSNSYKDISKHLPKLKELNLASWLIDARGESLDYLKNAIRLYTSPESASLDILKQNTTKSFSHGFFINNPTDKDWRDQKMAAQKKENKIGKVIAIEKGHSLIIESCKELKINDSLKLITPENKEHIINIHSLHDITNTPIANSMNHNLVKIPWLKGITVGTIIF